MLKQVCTILYNLDRGKFTEVVSGNVIHGRKHPFFSQNGKLNGYTQIPGTGIYFKGSPMNANQANSYIKKLLACFNIKSGNFQVAVQFQNEKVEKVVEKTKTITSQKPYVVYLTAKARKCPDCGGELLNNKIEYMLYDDETHTSGKPELAYTKYCKVCQKSFMTSGTYETLCKQKPNFKERINFEIK